MEETLGNIIADYFEGQLSEEKDAEIRRLDVKDIYKIFQTAEIIE